MTRPFFLGYASTPSPATHHVLTPANLKPPFLLALSASCKLYPHAVLESLTSVHTIPLVWKALPLFCIRLGTLHPTNQV